ncbi:hypothetical protein MNBD_CHLOROFLEXI01-132, partial [hydrothermal vent metagenome]
GETDLLLVMSDSGGLGGSNALRISEDGRFITFWSSESRLVNEIGAGTTFFFIYDREEETIFPLPDSQPPAESCVAPELTTDARLQSFPCFWLVEGQIQGGIFSYDQVNGELRLSQLVNKSSDGRFATFASGRSDLVANDSQQCDKDVRFSGPYNCIDIFVYVGESEEIERISLAGNGVQSNGDSYDPVLSADGRYAVFVSNATNLVAGVTGCLSEQILVCNLIYLYDRQTGNTELISQSADGVVANKSSRTPNISDNGRFITFVSAADNLVADDTNRVDDVFVYDRQTGNIERVSLPNSFK